jgi:dynein heavy chain
MAERCIDLLEITQVLEQFQNILGPELKGEMLYNVISNIYIAVTGDSHRIDEVLHRVEEMVHSIESVPFDLFDKRRQTSWETVMNRFHENEAQIAEMTKQFIDISFSNLRSSEAAFELLQKFKNLKSRAIINKQMMDKFSDVLKQYSIELQKVKEIFESNQSSPPFSKNMPPIAGSISWCDSLFYRVKKPIIRFKTMPGMPLCFFVYNIVL